MLEIYAEIKNFNFEYQTSFASWDKLLEAENWRKDNYPKTLKKKKITIAFFYYALINIIKQPKNHSENIIKTTFFRRQT